MSKIQATVRFKIDAGKLHEFQNLVNQCLQTVRQKDKETLQYDIFYDDMASECVIREMYEPVSYTHLTLPTTPYV